MTAQHLIFDADDTLWENNIYFEEAFDRFCEYLAHSHLSPKQVRAVLDEIEIANAKLHGYGSKNFARNLAECLEHLTEKEISEADIAAVKEFAHAISDKPIELLDGVEETVSELSQRHELTIFTKGDPEEQRLKIDRSGLARYFDHAEVVKEKDESAYRALARSRNFDLDKTWMVGNSPKSDINPALSAGLKAVFVPYERTWGLELADMPESHPRLLRVETIKDLVRYF